MIGGMEIVFTLGPSAEPRRKDRPEYASSTGKTAKASRRFSTKEWQSATTSPTGWR